MELAQEELVQARADMETFAEESKIAAFAKRP